MKTKLLLALLFITSVSTSHISAQNVKSISIENIDKEVVWPAVFKAFQELKFPRPSIAKQKGTGQTGYYNYKSLMIKNRLRFKINYQADRLTISIFERQYYTNTGWADNPLPISKKRVGKILDPIKERIVELTKDKLNDGINQMPQTNPIIIKNKAGEFEDFVIVRTEDSEMDLLAVHKNGNIMGFDLYDDLKTVKTIVSRENKDSEAIIMEFDENGLPIGMIINNLIFKIISNTNGVLILKLKDQEGNFIGEEKITMNPPPINQSTREFIEDNKNHGPSYFLEVQETTLNLSYDLSDILGDASFGFSVVIDALDELTEGSNFAKVFAKAYPKKLGSNLILAHAINKIDPENRFFLNELSTFVPIIAAGAAMASVSTLAGVGLILAGLKISYDAYIRIKERHWPTPKIEILGDKDEIQAGSFGEPGDAFLLFHVKSNYSDDQQKIEFYSGNDLVIKPFQYPFAKELKNYYAVYAKVNGVSKRWVYASQFIDGKEIYTKKEIKVTESIKYFYLFNCDNCSDDPSNKQECEKKLKQCESSITNNQNIYFVLDENDKIIKCNKGLLNDARKSFVKSSTLDNHGFKSFVTEAPCSFNCAGFDDKQTIISLAHEAMDKIKIFEKMSGRYKKAIEPLKKEYIKKINEIAEKRTIIYKTKQSDPNRYYSINNLKVYGAHWEMNHITILLDVSFTRIKEIKKINDQSYYEHLQYFSCEFMDKQPKSITKAGIPLFNKDKSVQSFGIGFSDFEKECKYVDFKYSEAHLTKMN